jgi:hypothetical protein
MMERSQKVLADAKPQERYSVLARNFISVKRRSAQQGPSLTEGREVILMAQQLTIGLRVLSVISCTLRA